MVTVNSRAYLILLSEFQREREYLFLDYLSTVFREDLLGDLGLLNILDAIAVTRKSDTLDLLGWVM
jgi:hypothetical protein